ncbi:MAG: addiction module antitoxin [Candidatus Peregrinibacteria bacterium Greene1014_49]|nr:MAG: addiction module antitoxin [Candidatus Peregrinibacteria bacterium Greene1014_49]
MRIPKTTKQFRRHYAKLKRSGKDIAKLNEVMRLLVRSHALPAKYRDHALQGEWQHLRDCHIEGDWLLLYMIGEDTEGNEVVIFYETGTHENLFG